MTEAPQLAGNPLEDAIAAQPYPKVTKDSIEAKIAKVDYLVLPDSTVTLCNITLKNGYSVRGESACVDPRNRGRSGSAVGLRSSRCPVLRVEIRKGYISFLCAPTDMGDSRSISAATSA